MQNQGMESPGSLRFSPVAISPGSQVSQGKNLTGNPRLVRDLVADIHASIQQWNAFHLIGIPLLKKITALKVDESFPEELIGLCEDLEEVCDQADNVVENLYLKAKQMKAISCLHKTKENLFTTMPIETFVSMSQEIYEAYQKEASIKRIILENVAHDHRESVKMLHITAWAYQTQILDCITTSLESMLIETKLR